MDPVQALERLGGVADAAGVLQLTSRRRLRRALRTGAVERLARGRYALSTASSARRAGHELTAVVALRSAAAHHGWELKEQPTVPELAVRRGRKLSPERRRQVRVLWMNLAPDQVEDGVTTPLRTVIDCARHLPFDEALAIADSALRSGGVTADELARVRVRGAGAAAVHRVMRYADGRAANPFESVLRALTIMAGLDMAPQGAIDLGTGVVHPDLVDRSRSLVIEADSWTHHATRRGHRNDCARYNLLVLHGWRVLRFTWEQVMHEQAYVRWALELATRRVGPAEVRAELSRTA